MIFFNNRKLTFLEITCKFIDKKRNLQLMVSFILLPLSFMRYSAHINRIPVDFNNCQVYMLDFSACNKLVVYCKCVSAMQSLEIEKKHRWA